MARKLVVVALALLLMLGALALVEFDSPELGRAVLGQAGAASGAQLEAETFRLNLLRGLELGGVVAAAEIPGGRYHIELDRLVFQHRLLPLLSGTVAVHRVLLERPRIELVTTGARPAGAEAEPEGGGAAGLALAIGEIAVEDASLEMRDETGEVPPVEVTGLDFHMRDLALDPAASPPAAGLSASGDLSIARVQLEATEISEARGAFTLSEGRLETQDVRFRTPEGEFGVDFSMDLGRVPLHYAMELHGDPLDLNKAAGTPGGFGPVIFAFDGEGRGTEAEGVVGSGTVQLAEGKLPPHPVLAGLEQATGVRGLTDAYYEAAEARFRVARGQIHLEPLTLKTERASLELGGRIGLDEAQTLDLELALDAPREGLSIAGVGDGVLDTLADDQGRVRVPLRVTGTSASPRVRPDTGALLARARQGGLRGLGRKLGGLIGR